MHERSLVRGLLRQVERIMRQQRADRVVAVRLCVGAFSGVEPDLVRSAYEELSEETAVRGARLTIQQVPLEAECRTCKKVFVVNGFRFVCPDCRGPSVQVVRGEELMLESVILEQADA